MLGELNPKGPKGGGQTVTLVLGRTTILSSALGSTTLDNLGNTPLWGGQAALPGL